MVVSDFWIGMFGGEKMLPPLHLTVLLNTATFILASLRADRNPFLPTKHIKWHALPRKENKKDLRFHVNTVLWRAENAQGEEQPDCRKEVTEAGTALSLLKLLFWVFFVLPFLCGEQEIHISDL